MFDLRLKSCEFDFQIGHNQMIITWTGNCLQTGKPSCYITSIEVKAQIPLRRLCDKVGDKFAFVADLSRTQIMKVCDTNHVAEFHD